MEAEGTSDDHQALLKSINPHITCYICKGYLEDATTVTECLHTFCKSCVIKHLEEQNSCPKCEILIHQSHPKHYITLDRSVQDVVNKLVPNFSNRLIDKRREFCESRSIPFVPQDWTIYGVDSTFMSSAAPEASTSAETEEQREQDSRQEEVENKASDCHRGDEQISLLLVPADDKTEAMKPLQRPYICCSTHATVTNVKKYIAQIVYDNISKYSEIDITCNKELMGKDHSLKFIMKTRWRAQEPPMELHYRPHAHYDQL